MEDKYFEVIRQAVLFEGIREEDLKKMLDCLSANVRKYTKDSYIFHYQENVHAVGLMLEGSAIVLTEDYWGNRNIVANIEKKMTFAESYACVSEKVMGVSVLAKTDCVVMFLDMKKVLSICSSACSFHNRLIQNLVSLMAKKNLMMNEKLTYLTRRSTREKLLAYLSENSKKTGTANFTIPFDRQQLADYLSVDRSAMSNELSKMQKEGILTYHKASFTLHYPPAEPV